MLAVAPASDLAGDYAALYRRAVVSRILRRLIEAGQDEAFPWLRDFQVGGVGCLEEAARGWDGEIERFDRAHPGRVPLQRLDGPAARVVVAAGLIEEDVRFGSLFARLQDPLAARRPCVGMLAWLLAGPMEPAAEIQACCHQLVERGLLRVDNLSDPRAEWVLRLPVALWDLLHLGALTPASLPATLQYRPPSSFPPSDAVVVPAGLRQSVARLPAIVAAGDISALVVRGMEGSGRLTLVGAVARDLGRGLLVHDGPVGDDGWRLLGPLATLSGALAVVVARPGPGETVPLPVPPDLDQTVAVILGRSGGVSGAAVERSLGVTLGQPGRPTAGPCGRPAGSRQPRATWTRSWAASC